MRVLVLTQKGGAGKTNITVGLMRAAHALGKRVAGLDLDVTNPNMNDLLESEREFDISGDGLQPYSVEGMEVFSVGYLTEAQRTTLWEDRKSAEIALEVLENVEYTPTYDYLFVDMPPLSCDVTHTILRAINPDIDGVVLVTTPRKEDVADGTRTLDMLDKFDIECFGVILNKAFIIHKCRDCARVDRIWLGSYSERDLKRLWKKRLLATIPLFYGDVQPEKYIPDRLFKRLRTRVI